MVGIILAVIVLLYIALTIVWAVFRRKFCKTRIRFFAILISFVLALIGTFIIKGVIGGEDFATNTVMPMLTSMLGEGEISNLLMNSVALQQVVSGVVSSILAPLAFLLLFLVIDFFSWITCLLIYMIRNKKIKAKTEHDGNTKGVVISTIAFAVGQALIVLLVWMTPIVFYSHLVPVALDSYEAAANVDVEQLLAEQKGESESESETEGALPADVEGETVGEGESAGGEQPDAEAIDPMELIKTIRADYIDPLDRNFIVVIYRYCGAGLIADTLTYFDVEGQSVSLTEEIDVLAHFVGTFIMASNELDINDMGDRDIAIIRELISTFEHSKTMPAICAEFAHNATGAWREGNAFMGINIDEMMKDSSGMYDGIIDVAIEIVYTDTAADRHTDLYQDIEMVLDLIVVMIDHEVFSGEHDDLVQKLAKRDPETGKSAINDMFELMVVQEGDSEEEIARKERWTPMFNEIKELGMKALGSMLGDAAGEYGELVTTVTDKLNDFKEIEGRDEKVDAVKNTLKTELEAYHLNANDEIVNTYAEKLVDELIEQKGEEPITTDDVLVFFADHAFEIEEDLGTELPDEIPEDVIDDFLGGEGTGDLDGIVTGDPDDETAPVVDETTAASDETTAA